MSTLRDDLKELRKQFLEALSFAKSAQAVSDLRIAYLGKKGHLTALMVILKALSTEDKRTFGPLLNELKQELQQKLAVKEDELIQIAAEAKAVKNKYFDVSAYKTQTSIGHLHPYTHVAREIEQLFITMGYEVLDGQEVDSDYYNFSALNIPDDHPARDMYDTFWLRHPGMLLRTHTSTMQVRSMETRKPPIAVVIPGRCFRHEATDASHDFMFMQCEGFLIDKNITLSHLFATAKELLAGIFRKKHLEVRIRPGFFPFVEPGVEIDVQCPFCKTGCSVCKKTRWIEVFPGGLIHPNVLKAGGIDPNIYSGFAFGFGLTRLAMIKYGINDIRLLHSGKMKFLEQF